jgi:hypothetical protein
MCFFLMSPGKVVRYSVEAELCSPVSSIRCYLMTSPMYQAKTLCYHPRGNVDGDQLRVMTRRALAQR